MSVVGLFSPRRRVARRVDAGDAPTRLPGSAPRQPVGAPIALTGAARLTNANTGVTTVATRWGTFRTNPTSPTGWTYAGHDRPDETVPVLLHEHLAWLNHQKGNPT